ncbi:MAG: tetratricopeptide repeat protein [Planctomycetes bacterium]|nr:tetratricopeptide repeat protein [Planctomycetota bacterium]MCB9918129.1 tetratricopeptide repeat protein [Planctomycetota bacterium]
MKTPFHRFPIAFAAGALCFATTLAPLARAQDAKIQREVKLLRGLAKDWGFVELAQEHLDALRKSPDTTEGDQKQLAQVNAEVLYLGARRIRDLDKRQTVLADALQQFKDYLDQYGNSEGATAVMSAYAEACEYYGDFLSDRIELEKDPDKKKALEEEALQVFVAGIKASNDAMQSLEGRVGESNDIKIQYYLAWLRKGTLLRTWAKTRREDREVKADEAIQTLEDLALNSGEETPIGIKALLEMGVALAVKGSTRDGVDMFAGTIDLVKQQLGSDNPPPLGTQGLLFQFLEESTNHMTDIYLTEGRPDDVLTAVADYRGSLTKFNLPPQPRFQDAIFLNEARARIDKGGAENSTKALEIAKEVANRHPSDFIGLRAREMITGVLDNPGVNVGPEALMQAAKGELQASKFGSAVRAYKRLLRSLESAEDKSKYGLRAYVDIGLSFARQQRYLEAIYALMTGLSTYGPLSDDDKSKASAVNYLNSALSGLRRQIDDNDFVDGLKGQVDGIARRYADDKTIANRAIDDARRLIDDGEYDKAIQQLTAVEKSTDQYELSQTMIAFANMMSGDFAKARAKVKQYLDYTADPLNRLDNSETVKKQYREFAIADANFYLGKMLADEAFGRNTGKVERKPDPSKLKDVVDAFKNYSKEYGKVRSSYAMIATIELIAALIDLEKVGEAEAEYARIRKDFPQERSIGGLAVKLFMARKTNIAAIQQEIEAVQGDPTKTLELRDATQRMRAEVRKALSFATNYLEVEPKPNYQLLRDASELAVLVEDYDQALYFLQKVVEIYGNDKNYTDNVDKFVRPDIASILMRKGDYQTALKQIDEALKVRPKSFELKLLRVRALGGWCEFDESGGLRITPGVGRYKEAYELMFTDYRNYVRGKYKEWDLEYYQFRFDCMDLCIKAAQEDTDFIETAKKFYRQAEANPDNFETLKKIGPKGLRLFQLFQARKP